MKKKKQAPLPKAAPTVSPDPIVRAGNGILEDLRAKGFTDRETLAIGDYIVMGSVIGLANATGAWQLAFSSR
jgi:hypothetical protein